MANGLPTVTAAAPSLRDQILGRWGNYGEWNAAGIDRAQELSDLLHANGISDISGFTYSPQVGDLFMPDPSSGLHPSYVVSEAHDPMWIFNPDYRPSQLTFDGQHYGFLGDANNDGSYSKLNSTAQGPLAAWSARGHGNVGYNVGQYPGTGQYYIAPAWGSSSDASDVRNAALTVGSVLGVGYLADAYGLGAMGSGAGSGGMTTSEQIAMMSANGMADSEIAAALSASGNTAGAASLTGAGVGSGSGVGGIGALTSGSLTPLSTTSVDSLPSLASQGLGQIAPQSVTGSLANATMPTLASVSGNAGLGTTLGNLLTSLGVDPSTVSTLGDIAKVALPIAGAIAGSQKNPGLTSTQQSKTDPRIDPYLYGDSGILANAAKLYGQNPTGTNALMQQGQQMQLGLLTNPQVQAQLSGLMGNAAGMMNTQVAGNPFAGGNVNPFAAGNLGFSPSLGLGRMLTPRVPTTGNI